MKTKKKLTETQDDDNISMVRGYRRGIIAKEDTGESGVYRGRKPWMYKARKR